MGKAVVRQYFCYDGLFGYITFLFGDPICLPVLCKHRQSACSFYQGFPPLCVAVPIFKGGPWGSLLWLIAVSCWFRAGWHWKVSPEHRGIPTPTPACKPSLSSPHHRLGDHTCVSLSPCLQLRQKGLGNAKENNFPSLQRVPQSLLYRTCFLLNLEYVLRMGLFEICLSWREIFYPCGPVQ